MFTIVKYPQIQFPRRDASEPQPEIINHRNDPDSKRWSEKLRNEEITYKHLKQHRDELLESEIMYKKTIKQLEKEKEELLKAYEPTYNENKVLKSLLEHGPDAVKMKKLRKARKELGQEVDTLKDENKRLTEQMQELIKKHAPSRDDLLEKNWKDVLAESKKTKERNEEKVTQGPFPAKDNEKCKIVSKKETIKDDDEYDLQLDTVEKEIQILLNNVKYIKKQKEKLDYASLMNKGAIVKNSVLEKAIYDKLDEDLTKFKSELEIAKSKHDDIKEQLEQRAVKKDIIKKDPVDISESKTTSEKTMVIEQPITYSTKDTQTEEQTSSKNDETDKGKKKRTRKPNASIAVQTEFSDIVDLANINQRTMKYIEQYEIKKSKIREANFNISEKVSSTQIRRNYAKKLLVRREESPNKDDRSNNIPKHVNKILLDIEDKNPKRIERPLNTQKKKKPLVAREGESPERVERSTNKQQKTNRTVATKVDGGSNIVEKSDNNLKQGKYKSMPDKGMNLKAETLPMKPNKEEDKTYRKSPIEHLPKLKNSNMSYARLDVLKPENDSRSVDVLDVQQDLFDYENMIMNPRAGIRNPKANINPRVHIGRIPKSRFERKPNDNLKLSRIKSKSSAEINLVPTHPEKSAKKHRQSVGHPSKERISLRSGSVDSWKSESDLPIFSDSESDSVKPFKDLRITVKKKKNFINLRGILDDGGDEVKRDESAYDKVLHDLHNQQKKSAKDVSQDFNKTVHNFREYKGSSREKQNQNHKRFDIKPHILPLAPLTFTEIPSDSRENDQK